MNFAQGLGGSESAKSLRQLISCTTDRCSSIREGAAGTPDLDAVTAQDRLIAAEPEIFAGAESVPLCGCLVHELTIPLSAVTLHNVREIS